MNCCKDPENKDCIVFKILLGIEILVLILVCLGVVPRELVLVSSALVLFYIIVSPIEDGLTFFIASVPIFVALPISETFDSLSVGRIFILILFFKWIFVRRKFIFPEMKTLTFKQIFKNCRFELFAIILFLILALSIIHALNVGVAVKRLIYLLNLSVIFILVKDLTRSKEYLRRIIKAILISFGIVIIIGLLQLISVYFFNIGNFWDYWANNVAYNFYGGNLRDIVNNANAWFAASPTGSSVVRLFGSFTDPHSFALYLLLICPFLYLFVFPIYKGKKISGKDFVFILTLFFIILSGTRGIWFSIVIGIVVALYLCFRRKDLRHVITCILITLSFFVVLIPVASVFTAIPQFGEKVDNNDSVLILKRLTSILDINETSNQGRIYIWKKSLESIKKSPLLGVGIGNFPVALEQDIKLAKAGSSAHNLYLNFAVEGGIFAFVFLALVFLEILFALLKILRSRISPKIKLLTVGIFVYFVWIFGYGFFDIALLDERVFLLFLTIVGIIFAIRDNTELQRYE